MEDQDLFNAIKKIAIKVQLALIVFFLLIVWVATCSGQRSPSFDEAPKRSYYRGRVVADEVEFRWQASMNFNLGGTFEGARCDLPDQSNNKLIQPAFGGVVATRFADITAMVSTSYGSYLGLMLQSSIQGYPLAIMQPDLDLGSIQVEKLALIEFGVELDDTRSPMFGTFFRIGTNISFPVGNAFGALSFKRIRPKKPSTAFWQVSAKYRFAKKS